MYIRVKVFIKLTFDVKQFKTETFKNYFFSANYFPQSAFLENTPPIRAMSILKKSPDKIVQAIPIANIVQLIATAP